MEITEDDVLRSVKTLAPLGSGFQVLQIGDKKMVSSVPRELNRDQSVILGLVQVTSISLVLDLGHCAAREDQKCPILTLIVVSFVNELSLRKRMDMSMSLLCAKI